MFGLNQNPTIKKPKEQRPVLSLEAAHKMLPACLHYPHPCLILSSPAYRLQPCLCLFASEQVQPDSVDSVSSTCHCFDCKIVPSAAASVSAAAAAAAGSREVTS